jgi:hypothetical protein
MELKSILSAILLKPIGEPLAMQSQPANVIDQALAHLHADGVLFYDERRRYVSVWSQQARQAIASLA